MRHSRSIVAVFVAIPLILSAAASVVAKGDAVVTLDAPLPTDPAPGSTVIVAWTLDMPDGAGSTIQLDSEGVFVRFTPRTGAPVEALARQDRLGHYVSTVTVPAGGLGRPVFGMKGEACYRGRGCERSDMVFSVTSETRRAVPDPVRAPVVPDVPLATVAPVVPVPAAQAPAKAVDTPPTQTLVSPAAASRDPWLLPLAALVGLAAGGFAAGLVLVVRGRGRSAAA